ncbi:MAG: hypothetical protein HY569_01800 [Candidatus Magasanikbacteria bacterium]|nr:hypothetical protein [Candidatus Magasanikbacteria bacterium]
MIDTKEPTLKNVLDAFNNYAFHTDQQLGGIKEEIGGIKTEIGGIKEEIGGIKTEIGGIKEEIGGIKTEIGGIKEEIGGIKTEIGGMRGEIDMIMEEVGGTKVEMSGLRADIADIRAQMVTKSYLDDKLADLRGDLTVLMRKEDTKLKALVDILTKKKVLSTEETKIIFSMEPFPQLAL